MISRRVFRRAVLPHVCLTPLLLAWQYAATHELPPVLSWVLDAAVAAIVAGVVAVWTLSSVAIDRPLVGIFISDDWRRLRAWWREVNTPRPARPGGELEGCLAFLGLIAAVAVALAAYAHFQSLWHSPLWFALFWQVADLTALTVALARAGQFRTDPTETERRTAETERARRDSDRAGAVSAVRTFYSEHAELIADEYPPVRFDVELRTRIPDSAAPEDAWRAAREFLAELLGAVRAARARRADELAVARTADPVHDRASSLRTLIGQLDIQREQTEQAIRQAREGGLNPAFLERQLADLHRRWREAADELERLARPCPPPTPTGVRPCP